MAYNLRTGLTGSGDIDVNVSLSDLDAANITSGQFGSDRIPILGDAKLSALSASKLTGTIQSDQIQNLQGTKIVGATSIPVSVLPALSTSQITSGTAFPTSFIPDLSADKIVSEQLHVDRIPDIPTSKLTGNVSSGNLNLATDDIPELPKSKISAAGQWSVTDLPTIPKYQVSTADTWALDDIPLLPATKIGSGIFTSDRIPDLSALKITSDEFSAARIPNLDASKITTGTIDSARLPSTSDILAYKAVTAEVGGTSNNTITNSYEVIDSNTSISFNIPSSAVFEVELSFYAVLTVTAGVNTDTLLARLVVADTVYEFASYYSAITTPSTEGTYMVSKGNSDNFETYFTAKWV
eukprot:COSAG06_NODE_13589_length_1241_cov_72.042907_1_plen_352_part_10